jgi:hypothetical protein
MTAITDTDRIELEAALKAIDADLVQLTAAVEGDALGRALRRNGTAILRQEATRALIETALDRGWDITAITLGRRLGAAAATTDPIERAVAEIERDAAKEFMAQWRHRIDAERVLFAI